MKKTLSIVLAVLMLLSVVLTGCGGGSENKAAEKIILTTGGDQGTYYGYCTAMSTILTEKTGIEIKALPSGASSAAWGTWMNPAGTSANPIRL